MKILRSIELRVSRRPFSRAACSGIAVVLSMLGCNAAAVRPSTMDSSADHDVTVSSRMDSGADAESADASRFGDARIASDAHDAAVPLSDSGAADASTQPASACISTDAPTCGERLPEARMLYEIRSGIAPRAPGGDPAPGCYLATSLVYLTGAFGYGPTSMRVVRTDATSGVFQVQAGREPGFPPYRIDLGYSSASPSALLDVRCPLDGFSSGRHRYAVRPNGSIELHWLVNDQVTGYMVFDRCAPTPSGGCS